MSDLHDEMRSIGNPTATDRAILFALGALVAVWAFSLGALLWGAP